MKEIFEVLNIFDKLGVHSLPEANVYAYQKGLVEGNELWNYSRTWTKKDKKHTELLLE